jgi:predicted ATP-grasp superfamily ATP-dependent carboligase
VSVLFLSAPGPGPGFTNVLDDFRRDAAEHDEISQALQQLKLNEQEGLQRHLPVPRRDKRSSSGVGV